MKSSKQAAWKATLRRKSLGHILIAQKFWFIWQVERLFLTAGMIPMIFLRQTFMAPCAPSNIAGEMMLG
jgi:hypothetical protein